MSELATELAASVRHVEAAEDVRARRVAELKAQIAAGTYKPDPREIARKIVEHGF